MLDRRIIGYRGPADVRGVNTRSEGKLLSVFEPSTEVIRKGKSGKPNEFGKMVKLQEAENQIIIDYEVYVRRPNDCDLLVSAIDTHQALLGRAPHLAAADAAKAKGVKRVCVPNRSTISPERKREQKKRWFRDGQKWLPVVSPPLPLLGRCRHAPLGWPRRHR
jgi:transposase, IS5 family